MSATITLTDVVITLPDSQAHRALRQLQDQLGERPLPSGELDVLPEEHPMWQHYSGGDRHAGPQWTMEDLEEARATLDGLSPKAKVFFDILLDQPGRLIASTELVEMAPEHFSSPSAVAGALHGFTRHCERAGRVFPFYWWESTTDGPTRYAIKPSVAAVFNATR